MKTPEILYVDVLPTAGEETQLAVMANSNQYFRYVEGSWVEIFPTKNTRL